MECDKINDESESNLKFYEDAEKYWKGIPPTLDGMLGGFSHISSTDIAGSTKFLNNFTRPPGLTKKHRALDCGAGIGRITKRLLLPNFKTVDMVELNQSFLDKARTYLGEGAARVEQYICCGLQDFKPSPGHYDVIWCQWVLGHLTDRDFVDFFSRCRSGLVENGLIIVKENTVGSETADFDTQDSSFTRTKDSLVALFDKANLKLLREERQTRFPKDIYDVYMFALQ